MRAGAGRDEVDRAAAASPPPGAEVAAVAAERERVKAEREAKKLAKRLAKEKPCGGTTGTNRPAASAQGTVPPIKIQKSAVHAVPAKPSVTDELVVMSARPQVPDKGTPKTGVDHKQSGKPQLNKTDIIPAQDGTKKKDLEVTEKLRGSLETTGGETTKSKAELRAERRAKQDTQRAAKQAAAAGTTTPAATRAPASAAPAAAPTPAAPSAAAAGKRGRHRVNWFQHLYSEREAAASSRVPINSKELHPAVVRLGVQLSSRVIAGSSARCVALLHAIKQVVSDYSLPARTEFARGLEAQLAASETYLRAARPLAASMTNAIKHLRWQLTQLPNNISEFDAKCQINEAIDTYIRDQIEVAGDAISMAVRDKISTGDNILTYGCSSLVEKILKEAWSAGVQFRAVVVGSHAHAPARGGGRDMLRRLHAHGVPTAYVHISALSFLMRTVHKVVLGAASLLGNGWVLAGAGTAQVALAARACNVPVLVCCPTHKFSERVQTDAFVYNEIGEPDALVEEGEGALRGWRQQSTLTPLALAYDVTPPGLVTAVVTELAVLPCTSAPVVLRFKLSEYGLQ